jgi:germination protein YpeB
MSIRDKLKDVKNRLTDRHLYSVVLVATALIATAGIYQYKRSLDYRNLVENQYNRAFHEVVGYIEDVEVSLAKSMLVTNPGQIADISSEIWRKSAFAQANLGQLPISHIQLDNTSKFLSQIGDYTHSLSRKAIDNKPIEEKEFAQLEKLHDYSLQLGEQLNKMQQDLYSGRIQFGELREQGRRYFAKTDKNIAVEHMESIESHFQDYPTLIYDGPFSDHVEQAEARLIKAQEETTKNEAEEIAVKFLGQKRAENIEYSGEGNGQIKTYVFHVNNGSASRRNNEDNILIEVTKVGGHVLCMLDNKIVQKVNLDIEAAKQKATEFLVARGIENMEHNYYTIGEGVATINFAYVENGVVMYPDLVKVKISLDDGEVLGFESRGYIMAHDKNRQLRPVTITEEEAAQRLNPRLTVDSTRIALIPLDSGREVLCYEFKGTFNDKTFLVYINAETGSEEKILILLETPNGVLTM